MQWSLYNTIALGIGIWTFGSCIGLPEVNCAASVNGHGSYFSIAGCVITRHRNVMKWRSSIFYVTMLQQAKTSGMKITLLNQSPQTTNGGESSRKGLSRT
ncbi:hypothetical protein BJV77DRAFT_401407 [Russula vinacea]|nr:hypothetical protein BJV77DRAFT_401407 [Russula vinacea]